MGLFDNTVGIEKELSLLTQQLTINNSTFLQILNVLGDICREIHSVRFQLSKPGQVTILPKEQVMDKITFKVLLPTLTDADVVSRELTVKVADGTPVIKTVAQDVVSIDGFDGLQGTAVQLSLVDIDDAGNRSEASTITAVLKDVFPPAKPGFLSIVQTGEVITPDILPGPSGV